jgi:hypothetical protein
MAEHDDGLVVSKTSTVSIEGLKVSLAPGGSTSPSTLVVMCGMAEDAANTATGAALSISSAVTDVTSAINDGIAELATTLGDYANVASHEYNDTISTLAYTIKSTEEALAAQTSKIMGGMHSYFNQAITHVKESAALKSITDTMSSVDFPDLGSGITDMASMAQHGLSATLGHLPAASAVMTEAGKVFDVSNMATFGTAGGLVASLMANKLGNHTGIVTALGRQGVDMSQIHDPSFAPQVQKALSNITDTSILTTVSSHFGTTTGSFASLADFTNISKFNIPDSDKLVGGFAGLSSKMSDLGASFATPGAASAMLNNLELPKLPALESYAPSLPALAEKLNPCLEKSTGTNKDGSGPPKIDDFMSTVNGHPAIDDFAKIDFAGLAIGDPAVIDAATKVTDACKAHLDYVGGLFDKAGMSLSDPMPTPKLASIGAFASSLHDHGADPVTAACLAKLANPSSIAGQAVQNCLAEGKNKALMLANGISPIDLA